MSPVQVSYPGVYIEEIPSGVRAISGVSTSITAFVGLASYEKQYEEGDPPRPKRLFSYADYEREFGPPHPSSDLATSVRLFFLNGGSECYVINILDESVAATAIVTAHDESEPPQTLNVLRFTSKIRGRWGNLILVQIDDVRLNTDNTLNDFTVLVLYNGVVKERFTNCNLTQTDQDNFIGVLLGNSEYIDCEFLADLTQGFQLPATTQLIGGLDTPIPLQDDVVGLYRAAINSLDSVDIFNLLVITKLEPDTTPPTISIDSPGEGAVFHIDDAADLESLEITIEWTGSDEDSGIARYELSINGGTWQDKGTDSNHTLSDLGEGDHSVQVRVWDRAGNSSTAEISFKISSVENEDTGNAPTLGTASLDTFGLSDAEYYEILTEASRYCMSRRAFLLIDPLDGWDTWESPVDRTELMDLRSNVEREYSAVYFPRLEVTEYDPVEKERQTKIMGPAAAIAGIIARVDAQRGVWKAPAGVNATIKGILGLDIPLTDQQNGVLNLQAINCIRSFVTGIVCWGARTVAGFTDGDWKYVPIRRLALYIEETLYRETKWVVFEPNDEPTWAAIRTSIKAFMMNLFRQGAFQGASPKEAFFVKCDKDTTTEYHRRLGIVNIIVGFAPLKPAEFVIIQIQQISELT